MDPISAMVMTVIWAMFLVTTMILALFARPQVGKIALELLKEVVKSFFR